jgi:Family of unknown function (DUF5372)
MTPQLVRITHPFHPLSGRKFRVICRRRCWGEDRVVYEAPNGRICTIASAWTDIDPVDEFQQLAGKRAAFRTIDLLALCDLLDGLTAGMRLADE